MTPINVAIIGYGMSAKIFHIPFVQALPNEFALYGVLQRNPNDQNDAARDHPNIKTWKSLEPVLADPAVDLVIVTSIPSSHFDLVKQALVAKKHVLCEKPFVESSARASELARLANAHGVVLSVYQNRRWDADLISIKDVLEGGELGRIAEFESHFDRHRPDPPSSGWKTEANDMAGTIFDLGSHLLDQFLHLFGMPDRLTGFITNQRVYEAGDAGAGAGGDSFTVLLHYDKLGMLGTAKAGVVSPEVKQLRFWVRGTKGSLKKFNLDVQEPQLKEGKRPGQAEFGVEPVDANGTATSIDPQSGKVQVRRVIPTTPPATYLGLYRALASAIRGEGPNPVSAEENSNLIKLIESSKLSSKEGRTIVL